MLILPLGLTAKTKNVPVVTIALTVVTIAVSLIYWKASHHYGVYINNEETQLSLEYEYRKAFLAQCDGHLKSDHCQSLQLALAEDSPRNFVRVHHTINESLPATTNDQDFLDILKALSDKFPPKVSELSASNPELTTLANHRDLTFKKFQHKHQVLSQNSLNPISLLKAQFIHDGILHLGFNLIFLFGFAAFVEQRVGSVGFFGLYLAAGFVGLALQSQITSWPHTQILGASANIFGVAGAFTVLFFRHKINLLFSAFFVLYRRVQLNALVYVGIFVLLSEVSGVLKTSPTGVAHWAHLGGFFTGATLASIFTLKQKVTFPLAYPYELDLLRKAQSTRDEKQAISILLWLLDQNPKNHLALQILLTKPKFVGHSWQKFNWHQQQVLQRAWQSIIKDTTTDLKEDELSRFIELWPQQWPEPITTNVEAA